MDPTHLVATKCFKFLFQKNHKQQIHWLIVVVQVGTVKIYVAAVETLTKKKARQDDETQFTTKYMLEERVWVPVISFC